MRTNSYFLKGAANEQKLIQGIINENIQIFGVDCLYLPRKVLTKDELLGENYYSQFSKVFWIAMYLKDAGYQQHGFNTNVYGIIDNEVHLVVSKDDWIKFSRILNNEYQDYSELTKRPLEGDLIWIPFLKQLYEIKLVDHEATFYTIEKLYTYQLNCELYRYSPEKSDLQLEEYENYSEESGFVRMVKLTNYANELSFKELELVTNRETNRTAKVVRYDHETREIYLREVDGDFVSGIIEGQESGAVAEIETKQSKKRRPKKSLADNKMVEDIKNEFFNNINNPFLR